MFFLRKKIGKNAYTPAKFAQQYIFSKKFGGQHAFEVI